MKTWSAVVLATGTLAAAVPAVANLTASADNSVPSGALVESINQNPDNLTPGLGGLAVDDGPEGLLNASLVRLDLHDKWQGFLATKWTVSKDAMHYTFTLNPKAKWSDGEPLTSADVVYTWKYYTNPKIKFTYVTGWDYVKSVVAKGKYQVEFTLKKPYSPFMSTIGLAAIVPEHVFSKWTVDQINHGYYNTHSIGAGPYILQSWDADQQLTFVPNPNWWGPKVHIQQIIYQIIPDQNTMFNELLNGTLTIGSVPPEHLQQINALKANYNLVSPIVPTYVQITPVERGFLKDVNVRIALDYATPRDQIVKYILKGQGVPAFGDQVPGSYYYNKNMKPRPFDLKKAAAILAKEGFKKGAGGWLYKNGQRLTVPIWTGSTSTTYITIAQAISQKWESIGVYAPVKTADWSFIFGQKGPQFNGKAEALLFSWGQGVFPEDVIDFNSKYILKDATSSGENAERYSNPLMDKLTVEGTEVPDGPQRQKIYYQIQELEQQTVPLIFLYWLKSTLVYSKHLKGFQETTFGTTPVWEWSLQ